MSNNKITQLPPEIFELPLDIKWKFDDSNSIFLGNNPLDSPPIEIVERGKKEVVKYLLSLESEEKQPLTEVKLLLVGDGGAGKTSLIKRLLGLNFDEKESTTHGININNWKIKDDTKEIQVNIWDFGGQEIMHSTHQFFLSKRSLYILVLDSRKDEKAEYWLKHIESFGGDSPILVVMNKIDENQSFEVNRKFLKEKYPSIKGFYRVSCKTKHGIDGLCDDLKQYLGKIQHISTTWPKSWFNVKIKLENMTEPFISYEEYEHLCCEEGIIEEAQDTLVDFLNDLGVVLHFNDFTLLDTHVLEPKWVTNAVYKIINSKELSDSNGILKLNLLNSILKKSQKEDFYYPPTRYKYIIDLMKKFELCYSVDEQTVLIPELLEVEEPAFDFNHKETLNFLLQYTDFLPKSVIPRFIVKMNEDIKDNLRWRTGVVLESNYYASAVVKSDEDARKIYIEVTGNRQSDYLSRILENIQSINKSFTNLNVDERVPMTDNPKITVPYSHLISLGRSGKTSIIPEGTTKEYEIKDLLRRYPFEGFVMYQQNTNQLINIHFETNTQNGDTIMRDKIENRGSVIGSQGTNSQGTVDIQTFNQVWQENIDEIDIARLAEDLEKLKASMMQEAKSAEQFESLTNVVHAQEAADKGNGEKTLEYLSKAGKWALEISRDIGVEVAATVLSKSLGL